MLSGDVKEEIDRQSAEIEETATERGIQEKYMNLLDELEKR